LAFFTAISVPGWILAKLLILNYLVKKQAKIMINFSLRGLKFLYISSKNFSNPLEWGQVYTFNFFVMASEAWPSHKQKLLNFLLMRLRRPYRPRNDNIDNCSP